MTRWRRSLAGLVAACSMLLVVSACSTNAGPGTAAAGPAGDPVSGGVARAIQVREPVALDPAQLANTWVGQGLLGNALYGTLMIDNPDTLEIEYTLATDFTTTDGGNTFVLTLRPDLTFTDGTPLDAEAVKFNWDRLRDTATASNSLPQASQVAATEVVDATTLKATLAVANPMFPYSVTSSALNWIASPTALQKGRDAFNSDPAGAGPFVLAEWTRQDTIELERNPGYWDAPRPYLDRISLRTVSDAQQRINMLSTGGADLGSESSWSALSRAEDAGLVTDVVRVGGGQYLAMNHRTAPFDDPRARQAVASALDLDGINTAVFEGMGEVPETLFPESSPFYADIPLSHHDPAEAQALFDELAAEGKPVEFTFTATSLREIKSVAETVQAQLSSFDNVDVKVEILDYAAYMPRIAARDFGMTVWAADSQEPDSALWNAFHSRSPGNVTGVADPELDLALDQGRAGGTAEDRSASYETVQQRLAELLPGVWYIRAAPSIVAGANIHGIRLYALASPLPEQMWVTR
ncbi:ABC transporter substrate-binding protein [Rhodococcus sp. NPDC060084]|uniref:ABC transporter substrate-binding protein n=1 Tax=Rhodococcus sp. NPDC060084 TaxID=3347053 RepID=UPI00364EE756